MSAPPQPITENQYRTHTNGALRQEHVGQKVRLSGWVNTRRDHGGLIFIDLRDKWGITQLTFDPSKNLAVWEQAEKLRSEYVISITGTVTARPQEMVNTKLPTGEIEIEVEELQILNPAKTPPFEIDSNQAIAVNEELRLTYRYLDLRRQRMQKNLALRHHMLQTIRTFFYSREFTEIETPILIKGTPEGAREYLVPSRLYPGQFYVLPQSPQQLKQLSMIAGFERYMQIARCFRDEDQRGDRQPEFTQVDIEMSFIEPEDILVLTEQCLIELTKAFRPDVTLKDEPFPRLTWEEAMSLYGSDKPDLRYDLAFHDVTDICQECGFKVFADTVAQGKVVKVLRVPAGASFTRKDIDELTELAKVHQAKGLAWIRITATGSEGVPVDKMGAEKITDIIERTGAQAGDILLFAADTFAIACQSLGAVRQAVANKQNLIDRSLFAYCWVIDFPLFAKDPETNRLTAMHHPFTRPKPGDEELIEQAPEQAKAQAYDIALNGFEIAGGSMRIHESELQQRIFTALSIEKNDAKERFGHMLHAFEFGAPPHGGIAWGFDRLVMLFAGENNIREVIAYPKDQKAKDLMLGAPSKAADKQLSELHIKIDDDLSS